MNLLNLEDEKFKIVTVKGQKFKIRAMFPKDKVLIAQRRMALQNGNPITSLSDGDFYFFENIAINDVCIESMPEELKEVSLKSSLNWPDQELINMVADEIRKHTLYLEEELKKNRPIEGIDKG